MKDKSCLPVLAFLALISLVMPLSGQGPITPTAPPGPTFRTLQEVQPRIPLHFNGSDVIVITEPGAYVLAESIDVTSGPSEIIQIFADGVDIDLNGQFIKCPHSAIIINGNLTAIRNGRISAGTDCITNYGGNETNLIISDVIFHGLTGVVGTGSLQATNCLFETDDFGVSIQGEGGAVQIRQCIFNGYTGIHVSDKGVSVEGCVFRNTGYGLTGGMYRATSSIRNSSFENIPEPVSLSANGFNDTSKVVIVGCTISTPEYSNSTAISLAQMGSVSLLNSHISGAGNLAMEIDYIGSTRISGCTVQQNQSSRFTHNRSISISNSSFEVANPSGYGDLLFDGCGVVELQKLVLTSSGNVHLQCSGADRLAIDGFEGASHGTCEILADYTRNVAIKNLICSEVKVSGATKATMTASTLSGLNGRVIFQGSSAAELVLDQVQGRQFDFAGVTRGSITNCTADTVDVGSTSSQMAVRGNVFENLYLAGKEHSVSDNGLQSATIGATDSVFESNRIRFGCNVTGARTLVRRNRGYAFTISEACVSAGVVSAAAYEAAPSTEVNIAN